MDNKDILCINGLVDGVTKNKIYSVVPVEIKDGKIYYGLIDDYGVYNLFKEDRFITITGELVKSFEEYKNK